jgi:class 3 adenylate cyclase
VNCPECGHENPEGSRFCNGCGAPLGEPSAAPERDPRAYTPKHLAEKILQSKSALEGERKQVTVLFADVGAPIAHEDHAQRACYAALYLRDELRRYARDVKREHGLGFSVRMGLNSGEVVVGKIGDDLRMDYTAQGQTVGLAARLEQLASPDTVYVSEHTTSLVSGYFELENLGSFNVKGVRSISFGTSVASTPASTLPVRVVSPSLSAG